MGTRRQFARGLALSTTGALLLAGMSGNPAAADTASTTPSTALRASALMNWYVSASLVQLRSEINSRWPNRDRSSDGTIGDARHQAGTNSHNPVGHSGGPKVGTTGAVHAMDITASGINVSTVLNAVIGDSRVWYVIYGGKIWSRTYGWAARTYTGDPHTSHIHINLREDSQAAAVAAEKDTSVWLGKSGSANSSGTATVTPAVMSWSTSTVKALQKALISRGYAIPAGATGYYGTQTTAAVKAFQLAQGWRGSDADGIAGKETLRRLGVTGATTTTTTTKATSTKSTSTKSTSTKSTSTKSSAGAAYTPGTASTEIYYLQQALIKRGYSIPAGPTGYYGERTVAAVKAFQKDQGWTGSDADGVAGRGTLKRLGLA